MLSQFGDGSSVGRQCLFLPRAFQAVKGLMQSDFFQEQGWSISLKSCQSRQPKLAASGSEAVRVHSLLQAVSISYKCLFYRKELWLKHMQENECQKC